eukprot:521821_1
MSIETESHPNLESIATTFVKPSKSIQKSAKTALPSSSTVSAPSTTKPTSKWAKQKAKRKRRKQRKKEYKKNLELQAKKLEQTKTLLNDSQSLLNEIDYISDTLSETAKNNLSKAFERFTPAEDLFKTKEQLIKEAADEEKLKKQREKEEKEKLRREDPIEAAIPDDHKPNEQDQNARNSKDGANKPQTLSNKQRKRYHRPTIALLKKAVIRSDLVEEHDVNAPDPYLLIDLKSMRNTVPVPGHWLQKRKYLQGKRGFLKPPFKLPSYIEATGITKMRDNRLNVLGDKSMKQKQREKMRPKKGGLEISYNILHEAFFRHQTKPDDLTGFGDLYYEGKEFMMKFRKFKPGFISDNLKKALSMTPRYRVVSPGGVMVRNKRDNEETGDIEWYDVQELKYGQYVVWDAHSGPKRIRISAPVTGFVWLSSKDGKEELLKRCDVEDPPPWLINMQRFGPPPSYPDLKIPGLNAPIPTHKMYGFHEGQWGKPPVDENGQPLYGDPFGIWTEPISKSWGGKSRWGVLEKFEETESEEDSDMDEDEEEQQEGQTNEMMMRNAENGDVSGISSGVPSQINLRKNAEINLNGIVTPTSSIATQEIMLRNEEEGKELYQVLETAENTVRGKFGSSTVYKMPKRRNEEKK